MTKKTKKRGKTKTEKLNLEADLASAVAPDVWQQISRIVELKKLGAPISIITDDLGVSRAT